MDQIKLLEQAVGGNGDNRQLNDKLTEFSNVLKDF